MKKTLITICLLLGMGSSVWATPSKPKKSDVQFKLISTHKYEGMLGVKTKITNTGTKHINSCMVTCILIDGQGNEVGFAKHYVIKSLEGGLASGASTYFNYVIDVSKPKLVKKVKWHVDTIN